jgi:Tfp pilus assembly protein PilN
MPGIKLTPEAFSVTSFITFFKQTPRIFWAMTLGGVIIGLPLAIAGYVMAYSAVDKYQRDIRLRLAEKKEQRVARRLEKKTRKKENRKARKEQKKKP